MLTQFKPNYVTYYMYELKNIKRNFDGFSLNIPDFCFKKGDIYAVTGPNGCGKSTFLNILAFIDRPAQGEVLFQGCPLNYHNGDILSARRKVSYLLQNPYLFDTTVYNNIAYGMRLKKMKQKEIDRKVQSMLSRFSLSHLAKKNAAQLSGGEAQKVALARTLVLDNDVLLLDEPTANVDRNYIRIVEEIILEMGKEKQKTIIVTTHSQDQAHRISSNIISIINGKIKSVPYENIFSGILQEEKTGLRFLPISGSIKLELTHGKRGPVTLAVDPNDIILSLERLESSARNNFCGVINKVENINGSLRVRVCVDAGVTFCGVVTKKSYYGMGLNIGEKVWVTFKANAVKVLNNDYI